MADKAYYWLKLKRDFFKRHDVRIIEAMPNGREMVLFYVKLLCESIDHEGRLRFSDEIPYTPEMLASITETDVEVAKQAMGVLESLRLLGELEDGTFFLTKAESMVGSETVWAEKKRKQKTLPKLVHGCVRVNSEMLRLPNGKIQYVDEKRYGGNGMLAIDLACARCENCGNHENLVIHHDNGYSNDIDDLFVLCTECHGKRHSGEISKLLHSRNMVENFPQGGGKIPQGGGNFPTEKESELETESEKELETESEKELEKEKEKKTRESTDYQLVADMYNETCVSFPRLTSLSDARKKAIRARLNNYTVEDFQRLFEMAEASSFLKGANDRNWTATFDWLIKDGNMAKVLDGNYADRNRGGSGNARPSNRVAKELEESYDMMRSWAEGGD